MFVGAKDDCIYWTASRSMGCIQAKMRKEGGLEKITVVTQGQGGEAYIETSLDKEEKLQEPSREAALPLISSFPVLDAQRIMELRGVVDLKEVLNSFVKHGQNLVSGLKKLIEEENYVRAAKQAHALKGNCLISCGDIFQEIQLRKLL